MINIGVVCHSSEMVDKIIEFVKIFKSDDFNIINLGKSDSKKLGTSVTEIKNNIKKYYNGNPFLIFVDMGSSISNVYEVKEELKNEIEIEIANAPLLEGLITAVTANEENMDIQTLKVISEESRYFNKHI